MPNKDLQGRNFKVPQGLGNYLQVVANNLVSGDGKAGDKRLTDIIKKGLISYEQMVRIKSYFDNYDGDGSDKEFKLNGGNRMKTWVDSALEIARKAISNVKKAEMEGGKQNAYKKTHTKDTSKNPSKVRLARVDKDKASNIASGKTTYEQVDRVKVIMEYLNKRK